MSSNVDSSGALRWGVGLMPDLPVAQLAELAALAEASGFDRCWLFDEGLATRELYVTLTAVALSTDRIHLGPGITNPYTRHPGVTAAAIASLQELSGGRMFLGLGAGGSLTLDPLGIPRHRPNAAIRESIQAIRALFGGDTVDFDGSLVQLRQAQLSYADAAIPIWVAGRGPRVLATAAELADGISLDHVHRDFLADHVAQIRSTAAEAGTEVDIAYSATIVVTDADLERVRHHMTYRLADSPAAVRDAIGMTDADSTALRAAMADGRHRAARLVKDEWIYPFVIHGSSAECAAQIVALERTHRLREFTVPVPDVAVAGETIEIAAEIARQAAELE